MSLAVQGDDIFLHNLARCAIATALSTPTAGVGWSIAFIASWFAQKKDARPVGGRGISAFSSRFYSENLLLESLRSTDQSMLTYESLVIPS
ncbi:hypothetical protein BVY11_25590 [Pseudomonas amygdali pv. morsprunorum]|nr:hypothetical protein BVY11_25590 [Pseudomonas amygdali pv. morsprunorum]PPS26241.1 hypothetical protein BVY12_28015 [Pseudomonas amygdali pv. morsprunorum]